MSKRLSNKTHSRKTPARSRVRLGWKKLKMLTDLEKMNKAEQEKTITEDMQVKYDAFKQVARKQLGRFFPQVRRTQSRGS